MENFRPKTHKPPNGVFNALRFGIRLIVDLSVVSVYRKVKLFLSEANGNLLDLGCGESPYRFLVKEKDTEYHGVDIVDAKEFDYERNDITRFNGKKIPFADNYFDFVICTEVLEHVEEYQTLIDDVYRVMKVDGQALFTVPWSARYHYIPHDYFRYSPSTLEKIFFQFSKIEIIPRGTDVTSISAKLIVLIFRNLFPTRTWRYIFSVFWLLTIPLLFLSIIFGQLSLLSKFGSELDPIGYIVIIKK